jgi:hypothetical protein
MKGKSNKQRLVANDLVLDGYELLLLPFFLKLFPDRPSAFNYFFSFFPKKKEMVQSAARIAVGQKIVVVVSPVLNFTGFTSTKVQILTPVATRMVVGKGLTLTGTCRQTRVIVTVGCLPTLRRTRNK